MVGLLSILQPITISEWPEIQEQLYPGQTAKERHDIVARVFYLKVQEMKNLLYKKGCFGKRVAHCATIEFQKK